MMTILFLAAIVISAVVNRTSPVEEMRLADAMWAAQYFRAIVC